MKFRFALLVAALALALSISASAYSEEPAQDTAAPAQEETTTDDSAPFVLLRVYEGQFADVKDGDWFAPSVVSAYEYGVLNGRGEGSFAPSGNVTIAELLTIAARLRAIYTTGSDAVIPAAKENEAWYAPYVSYLKSQNLLDNSFEGFYLLPASRAQMAGIFAFAVPEEWYTEPNASLVTSAYASRDYIADVTDKTPYRSEILLMYRRGLLSGMDAKGSFYHSVKNATLASLVKAPASTSLPTSAKDTAVIDGLVRNMLARGEHTITLNYSKALTTATASALTQAFTSCVKTYCEQMYNAVSCRSYSTGKVVLTFSSTACTDKTLESYRAKALAAAIKVHDSLWESGTLSYDMSQYEIARTYFQWLCDHCRYAVPHRRHLGRPVRAHGPALLRHERGAVLPVPPVGYSGQKEIRIDI